MKNEITLLKQLTRFNPIAEKSHRMVIARRVLTLSFLALTSLASMPVRARIPRMPPTVKTKSARSPITVSRVSGM
jgi:hypothetical protein